MMSAGHFYDPLHYCPLLLQQEDSGLSPTLTNSIFWWVVLIFFAVLFIAFSVIRMNIASRASRISHISSHPWPIARTPQLTSVSRSYTTRVPSSLSKVCTRNFASTKMSYSNTSGTGDKPADPYTAKNVEDPTLKDKIGDLVGFVEKCKFCMMTTRIAPQGLLVSRCMALAGKVSNLGSSFMPAPLSSSIFYFGFLTVYQEGNGIDLLFHANTESGKTDDLASDPKINVSIPFHEMSQMVANFDVCNSYPSSILRASGRPFPVKPAL